MAAATIMKHKKALKFIIQIYISKRHILFYNKILFCILVKEIT